MYKFEHSDLLSALEAIPVSSLNYDEWKDVGMALKDEGIPFSVWDSWSSKGDPRYKASEMRAKWDSFGNYNGTRKTVKTIFRMAIDRGWGNGASTGRGEGLDWDSVIDVDSSRAKLSRKPTILKTPEQFLAKSDTALSKLTPKAPKVQMMEQLKALFKPEEYVNIVTYSVLKKDKQGKPKYEPGSAGEHYKQDYLIKRLELISDDADLSEVIGNYNKMAGVWMRVNATNGIGAKNTDAASYRHVLVEGDEQSIQEQYDFYIKHRLPISTLCNSGGRSLHAVVRVAASNSQEYAERVAYLFNYCEANGFKVDRANRNVMRLSRLAGIMRNGQQQTLVATNIGLKTWDEWYKWSNGICDEYLKQCKENLDKCTYLQRLGLSSDTLDRFNVGYDTEKDLIVIPDTEFNAGQNVIELQNGVITKQNTIFNRDAFNAGDSIFITDNVINALCIESLGFKAIALPPNRKGVDVEEICRLLESEALAHEEYNKNLVICLENSIEGRKKAGYLISTIKSVKGAYATQLAGLFIDEPNLFELYDHNRDLLTAFRADKEKLKQQMQLCTLPPADKYNAESNINYLQGLVDDAINGTNTTPIATGYPYLDEKLDGGLQGGRLYVMGAMSGLGKTAFCLQMADYIANNKDDSGESNDVLYFALEMSRNELMARSLSRISFDITDITPKSETDYTIKSDVFKTARKVTDILTNRGYNGKIQQEVIKKASSIYAEYASNLVYKESLGDYTVEQVRDNILAHMAYRHKRPIVFVDYLQIMKASDPKDTEKQAVDHQILQLKKMAVDFNIPVVVISSFNRNSYDKVADMTAFKESGAIEYSCDVLLTMELDPAHIIWKHCIDSKHKEYDAPDMEKTNSTQIRWCNINILKNRIGRRSRYEILLKLYAPFYKYESIHLAANDEGTSFGVKVKKATTSIT